MRWGTTNIFFPDPCWSAARTCTTTTATPSAGSVGIVGMIVSNVVIYRIRESVGTVITKERVFIVVVTGSGWFVGISWVAMIGMIFGSVTE